LGVYRSARGISDEAMSEGTNVRAPIYAQRCRYFHVAVSVNSAVLPAGMREHGRSLAVMVGSKRNKAESGSEAAGS